tara:strand:- start:41015 stop:41245 length:231 start_codon:yes stop_codon:yes gene_type:complete
MREINELNDHESLVDERNGWREDFANGLKPNNPVLNEYKRKRDNIYWRRSKFSEVQCEYILFLESEVERLNAIISK